MQLPNYIISQLAQLAEAVKLRATPNVRPKSPLDPLRSSRMSS